MFYAFFVAGAAVLTSVLFSDDLLRLFKQTVATPQGIALAKFSESIFRVFPILVLMPVMGEPIPLLSLGKDFSARD